MLGKQLLRSGTSVGANYREAHRGRSKAEFIARCGDSLRELEESASRDNGARHNPRAKSWMDKVKEFFGD